MVPVNPASHLHETDLVEVETPLIVLVLVLIEHDPLELHQLTELHNSSLVKLALVAQLAPVNPVLH